MIISTRSSLVVLTSCFARELSRKATEGKVVLDTVNYKIIWGTGVAAMKISERKTQQFGLSVARMNAV